jgi:selenocysteine lyase/cysteine desulfurase
MSTHKWLCNVKTCGIIRFGEKALPPNPPAISFGWDIPVNDQAEPSIEETQARFLWIGMLDSYVSYITLGKAIQV